MQDAQGAAPEQGAGGGVAELLASTDANLSKIAKAAQALEAVPDEVKAAIQTAHEAFRAGMEGLLQAAEGGGGKAQGPAAVAPEAGGNPNAMPADMRGGR